MELPNRLESEKLCAGLGKAASTHSAANKHVHAVYCGRIAPLGMALGFLLPLFLWGDDAPVVSIRWRCITPKAAPPPLHDDPVHTPDRPVWGDAEGPGRVQLRWAWLYRIGRGRVARYVWPSAALLGLRVFIAILCGRLCPQSSAGIKLDQKFFLCIFVFRARFSKMSDKPTIREELLRRQKNWQAPVRIGILDEFRMLELLPTR